MKNLDRHIIANEEYGEKYFKLLKVFWTNPKYKKMSLDAKVAYAFLKDRVNYSLKNNWVDKNGYVYFIFTNNELMKLLDCGKEKLSKIKKSLINCGLLEQKRMGLNQPNRLYLLKPEVTAKDIFLIKKKEESLEPQGSSKIELPGKKPSRLEPQGSSKIELPKKEPSRLEPQGSSKIEHNLYYSNKDTNKIHIDTHKQKEQIFSKNNYSEKEIANQNHQLLKSASDVFTKTNNKADMILNKEGLNWLSIWCHTPKQMKEIIGIILKAKRGVLNYVAAQIGKAKAADLNLYTSEMYFTDPEADRQLKYQLTLTLKKVLMAIRSGEESQKPVKNQTGYMYKAFYNFYANYFDKLLQESSDNSKGDKAENVITKNQTVGDTQLKTYFTNFEKKTGLN